MKVFNMFITAVCFFIFNQAIMAEDQEFIEMVEFIEQANNHQPTIKFAAEVSEMEKTFLDTNICKGKRF